ncbi:MAG: membrane protein insertion efficiency factor YidD [Chlamydiales bacterium]|nr:membrane protein insertion efficiency factor YidD [Chlamydiales bacterium]
MAALGYANSYSEKSCEPWGVDGDLHYRKTEAAQSHSLSQKACVACIRFFQNYISPIDGPRSSFYPTSSQYALDAIQKYGVLTGIALGCDRLMRENSDDWVYDIVDKHGTDRKYDPVR